MSDIFTCTINTYIFKKWAWSLNNFLKHRWFNKEMYKFRQRMSSIFEINSAEFLIASPNFSKIIRILSGYITCTCTHASSPQDGLRDKYIQNYVHMIAITRAVFHSQGNLSSASCSLDYKTCISERIKREYFYPGFVWPFQLFNFNKDSIYGRDFIFTTYI